MPYCLTGYSFAICFHLIKYKIHTQICIILIHSYMFQRSAAIMRELNQSLNLMKCDKFVMFKYLM